MAEVTVLSGPIGAGKTAVSKELIALWPAPLAYIEGDQFWPFLVKRAEGDRREDFRLITRDDLGGRLVLAHRLRRAPGFLDPAALRAGGAEDPEGRAAQLHRAAPAARGLRGPRPRTRRGQDRDIRPGLLRALRCGLAAYGGAEQRREPQDDRPDPSHGSQRRLLSGRAFGCDVSLIGRRIDLNLGQIVLDGIHGRRGYAALTRRRSAPRPRGRLARRRRPDPKTAFVARVARPWTNQCLPAPIRLSSAS